MPAFAMILDTLGEFDFRLLPLIFTCLSIISLGASSIYNDALKPNEQQSAVTNTYNQNLANMIHLHVQEYGGYAIFGFTAARFVGIVFLCVSTVLDVQRCDETTAWIGVSYCIQSCITITFYYSLLLSSVSLFFRKWATLTARHINAILLVTLAIYSYRNIWPLATYDLPPADISEGNLLWAKIATLFVVSIAIPVFIPSRYTPVDPKNPSPIPNPEQISSLMSKWTFSFVDSVIASARRVSHLSYEQLPPLSDTDHSKYQCANAFPHIDPFMSVKRRHLFFGLLYHFRWDYIAMTLCVLGAGIMEFSGPIAIKEILSYIETEGAGSTIKPWFWIGLLLVGPLLATVLEHRNAFLQTIIMVRIRAILTQLVFDHSLRIRLKAEAPSDSPNPSLSSSSLSTIASVADENSETASQATAAHPESTTSKAKDKETEVKISSAKEHAGDAENLVGKINNLVTSDLDNICEGVDFVVLLIYVPTQIILSIIFLSKILGWSAFVGLFTLLFLSPIPGVIAAKSDTVQGIRMRKTDARVQTISESINVIRMIKLFGWENRMSTIIDEKREDELHWLWKSKILRLYNAASSMFIPTLSMLATYTIYTVVMKEILTASKIFSSMIVFSIMRDQLFRISWQLNLVILGKVSLDRINDFMKNTELLDRFTSHTGPEDLFNFHDQDDNKIEHIGFRNATFAWTAEGADGSLTPSSRRFRLRVEDELIFKPNCLNMIIGPTGSGKTSILMALLGEMHFIPSQADSWFNLPRNGGIAYAAQESWVQSATIRENILFGAPFEEERYQKVIRQCALEHDLELFDAGDRTEVGERGLTLSGGQKARVTLARAVYSQAQIILLDDVLAALDVHTSTWIVDKCFRGDLVKGRTIILVTHNTALVGPVAGFVVSLGADGTVKSQGTDISEIIEHDAQLVAEFEQDKKAIQGEKAGKSDEGPEVPNKSQSDGKLIMAEEIVEGHITWRSMKLILSALGGQHPAVFFTIWLSGLVLCQLAFISQNWFLGVWGRQYEIHAPADVNLSFYLGAFTSIVVFSVVVFTLLNYYFVYRTVAASRTIHLKLVDSVFSSTFRWLDETPTSRIITRCTQDIRTIDNSLPQALAWVMDEVISIILRLLAVVAVTPIFLFPGIVVASIGTFIGSVYLKAQLSIKREMSNARSPLLAHFNASVHGLVSVRAYGAQRAVQSDSFRRIDHYSRIARTSWNVNRWVGVRMDVLGAFFVAGLAFYQVYGQDISASNTGFSLNMAHTFCASIFWMIRIFNQFEVESNSLERIQSYLDIDHEAKPTEAGKPPAAWPTSGELRVENLSAKYSQSGPKVLQDISFEIRSGERIGVVGRTGSGKSTLTLSLLRCLVTEGKVYLDGIATDTINLDALRSSMTIIPQVPELISGTLRQNLDPFGQNDDAVLNDALRSAGLFALQQELGETRLTLDSKIAGGGGNLSVGQRQIIALARAMVRGSKLLILDEATSAIDYKTDAIIQRTLRTQLGPDVTVITIAHRLQTIMDADKIMVLDKGKIAEFDRPSTLLQKERGALKLLVEESGDKSVLYELAGVQSFL